MYSTYICFLPFLVKLHHDGLDKTLAFMAELPLKCKIQHFSFMQAILFKANYDIF